MDNRINTLKTEIAERQAELKTLETSKENNENEFDEIIKSATR